MLHIIFTYPKKIIRQEPKNKGIQINVSLHLKNKTKQNRNNNRHLINHDNVKDYYGGIETMTETHTLLIRLVLSQNEFK